MAVKKKKARSPGRPPKNPEDRIRLAKLCATTFPPEIVAWLEAVGSGSRNSGVNVVVRAAFAAAAKENSPN